MRQIAAVVLMMPAIIWPATLLAQIRSPSEASPGKAKERTIKVHASKSFGDEPERSEGSADRGAPGEPTPETTPAIGPVAAKVEPVLTPPAAAIDVSALYLQYCWPTQPPAFSVFPVPAGWQPTLNLLGDPQLMSGVTLSDPQTAGPGGALAALSLGVGVPTAPAPTVSAAPAPDPGAGAGGGGGGRGGGP